MFSRGNFETVLFVISCVIKLGINYYKDIVKIAQVN